MSSAGGSNGGGDSGTVSGANTIHPGGGGGGWSDLNVAGQSLIVAGGGGGSGGGHATNGGFGGNGGLPSAPGVTAGSDGQDGFDTPAASVGGGDGGQAAAAGAGGVHGTTPARNGSAGSGQTGGDGGADATPDSGGGGGGGAFGGGGGASTVGNGSGGQVPGGVSGAGAGGGASSVAATSPDGSTAVTGISSAPGPKLPATGNGAAGQVQLQWVPCDYDLAVTKSAAPGTVAPGDTITWTVTVTNLGPDAMTQGDTVTLTDTLPGAGAKTITSISTSGGSGGPLSSPAVTCSAGVGAAMPATLTCSRPYAAPGAPGAPSGGVRGLNVGETLTITYTQPAQAADVGTLLNTATVDDRTTGDTNDTANAPVTVFLSNPSIDLDKQAGSILDLDANGADVGDTIDYTFIVTNTGNVPLNPVSVSDPKVGTVSCPPGSLAPGAPRTCTATYTLTQADVDAGVVNNTATASGTPPTGPPVTDQDNTTTPITRTPGISLDKQAGAINDVDANGHDVGDTIAYTFIVTNTGNVTLNPVSVSDPKVGAVSCPPGGLAPGAIRTCTATYTLTQADVDAGVVNNTATTSGTPPTGPPVTDQDNTTTPVTRTAAITLDKQAGTPSGSTVGSTIAYTFLVQNTGNVTLDPVSVNDPAVGAVTCPVTVLAPGDSTTCTATYTLTQVDVDAGHFANTATATGTPPPGVTPPTADDDTDTPIPAGPAISLDKQAGAINDLDANGHDVGDTIAYTFIVTNTGNVTLSPVSVSDPKVGAVSCPAGSLAAGASKTCTATYTLTQADVDAGVVNNTATASGTPPTGPPVTDQDNTTTPVTRTAAITLDKQAGTPSGSTVGSTIAYTFLVHEHRQRDAGPGQRQRPRRGCGDLPGHRAGPGCLDDLHRDLHADPGRRGRRALRQHRDRDRYPAPGRHSADGRRRHRHTHPGRARRSAWTSRRARSTTWTPTAHDVGDTIAYTFIVTNTGNVTLSPVSVTDPKVGAVSCPAGSLAPGASKTCTATYTLTQADVDAGEVVNTATATGTPPTGPPVTDDDTVTTTIPADPSIVLVKSAGPIADVDGNGPDVGDTIAYSFLVTNTGNVTLDPVSVADPKVGAVSCPAGPLAPNASRTCTATYTLTQADVNAGAVVNTATASGTPPTGPPVTDQDTVTTTVPTNPRIDLQKKADTAGPVQAGDQIIFSFTVTNTGNVTLTNLQVQDPMVGTVTCPTTTLAPGEQTTCTAAPYTVTSADVAAGSIVNKATASADGGGGVKVNSVDEVEVLTAAAPDPSIRLVKRADTAGPVRAGDEVTYSFTVTNTGNVTLTHVRVEDPMLGTVDCGRTRLKPGQSTTCSAPPYTVTAADVRDGALVNHASVTANACGPALDECVVVDDTDTVRLGVAAPSGALPDTGSAVSPVTVGVGLGLLGLGMALVLAGRRTRKRAAR